MKLKRALAIILLVLLPLNAAFAAAAGYCQHESESRQANHFGHHSHQHNGSADLLVDVGIQIDHDCGFCHLSCTSFVPSLPPVLGDSTPPPHVAPPHTDFQSALIAPAYRPPLAFLA